MKRILLFLALAATAAAQVAIPYRNVTSKPAALDAVDDLTPAANKFAVYQSGTTAALFDVTPFALTLLDDANAAAFKTTLTLQNVDNTSDATKWAATATLTNKTLNLASNTLVATSAQLVAALTDETGSGAVVFANSPALTGTPTAPTAAAGTNTTQVATTEFVQARSYAGDLSRASRDALLFDGASTGARAYWTLASQVSGIGAGGGKTVAVRFRCPTVVGPNYGLWYLGLATDSYGTSAYSWAAAFDSSGHLLIGIRGGSANSFSYRAVRLLNFITLWGGKDVVLVATWDHQTANLIYVNGVLQSGGEVTQGTAPAWTQAVDSTNLVAGVLASGDRFRGLMEPPVLVNRVWSAAEVLYHAETGRLPDTDELGAADLTGYTNGATYARGSTLTNYSFESDTASPPASWTQAGNHVVTATADGTAPHGANVAVVVASGAGSSVNCLSITPPNGLALGRRFRLQFWAKSDSGNTSLTYSIGGGSGWPELTTTLSASWQQFSTEAVQTAAAGFFRVWIGGAGTFRIDKVEIVDLGVAARPVIQPTGWRGGTIRDASENRTAGVVTTGVAAVSTLNRGAIRGRLTWSGTHEAKAFIADQALIPANSTIESIVVTASANTSGTGLSIGDGDTTAHWVASTTLTAGADKTYFLTLANRVPQSTAANDLKFYVDPDSANYTGTLNVTVNYVLTY